MWQDRIVIDSRVHHGRPVIRGSRVPVHLIVGSVAGGMTLKEVALEYGVEEMDVRAALEYASRLVFDEESQPLHA